MIPLFPYYRMVDLHKNNANARFIPKRSMKIKNKRLKAKNKKGR